MQNMGLEYIESDSSQKDSNNLETTTYEYINQEKPKLGAWQNFKDGFKRAELPELDPNLSAEEKANILSANSGLQRNLKKRHIQMIAIGIAIGTGLFVGSGSSLAKGGPASLLICYAVIGSMMFCVTQALGELVVAFPVAGSYLYLNSRFVGPVWGFLNSWNHVMLVMVGFPLELVAAAITIRYWNDQINSAAWVVIFYVIIVLLNIFGVRIYGEAESFFSGIKVIAIIGFIILGIILNCGGGPKGGYIGGKFWQDPGAFHNGFKGFCNIFVTAAYAFSGTELVGLTAAEAANPRKSIPSATKQVFWRITLFYIVALTMVGLLVPYNDPRLMGNSGVDAAASPFVIAIRNAGIGGLPSLMNVVILISVLSVANSTVYSSSRTLASMADQGFAPKILGYIDREGRPIFGIATALIFGLLCFLAASSKQNDVFNWLMALSGLSAIVNWMFICLCHLKFRRAMKVQKRNLDELSFTSLFGIWGSIYGIILNFLILAAEMWISIFPIGEKPSAEAFFSEYLNLPVMVLQFIIFLVMKKFKITLWLRSKDIDVDTGRRVEDLDIMRLEIAEEKAFIKTKPFYYRMYSFWC